MILLLVKFMTTKKVRIFLPSFLLLLEPGSKIKDLGWEKTRIWDKHPDTQHCILLSFTRINTSVWYVPVRYLV
jgi:hypothetical protein